jgi:hypothetical protein
MIRLLIMKYGFSPQRLSAGGYGVYHPIASNDSGSAGVKVGSQQAFSRRSSPTQGSFPCMVVKDSPCLSFRHENVYAH